MISHFTTNIQTCNKSKNLILDNLLRSILYKNI